MPENKRIAIGSDHAAVEVKNRLIEFLKNNGWTVTDFTEVVDGRADYPIAAHKVAKAVQQGEYARGLLMCGTGLGVSYVANRYKDIRAALCLDSEYARLSREYNDSNVLVMPDRTTIYEPHETILQIWLATPFSGDERHVKRIAMIENPS